MANYKLHTCRRIIKLLSHHNRTLWVCNSQYRELPLHILFERGGTDPLDRVLYFRFCSFSGAEVTEGWGVAVAVSGAEVTEGWDVAMAVSGAEVTEGWDVAVAVSGA